MQSNRRTLAGALACALLAALAACSDTATSPTEASIDTKTTSKAQVTDTTTAPAPAPGTTRSFYQGAYLGDAASTPENIAAAIRSFGQMTGKQPSLVKTFHSLDCDFTARGWGGQGLRSGA